MWPCFETPKFCGERDLSVASSGAEFVPDTVALERIVLAAEGC